MRGTKTIIERMDEADRIARTSKELERIAALEAQLSEANKLLKLANEDWAEDDTAIRNLCRRFLTEKTCDHDGYAVVPITKVVQNTIDALEKGKS